MLHHEAFGPSKASVCSVCYPLKRAVLARTLSKIAAACSARQAALRQS